jgi:hypothetical protein
LIQIKSEVCRLLDGWKHPGKPAGNSEGKARMYFPLRAVALVLRAVRGQFLRRQPARHAEGLL